MSFIKSLIKKLIYKFKSKFNFDKLSTMESNGIVRNLTILKLLPKTPLNVPFTIGRTCRGISLEFGLKGDSSFKMTQNIFDCKSLEYTKNELFNDLKRERNKTAAEISGCYDNLILKEFPSWAFVWPWEKRSIYEKFKIYPYLLRQNREDKGMLFKNKNKYMKESEMFSLEMAESHVLQTYNLYKKIKNNGLKNPISYPTFYVLKNNNKWRWCMSGEGNHRVYILYLLGFKNFHGIVQSIIQKKKIHEWPNVKNGIFNIQEAGKIFDKVFEGNECINSSF